MTKGFAILATPGRYGDSRIMTFMMNREVCYANDLGPQTVDIANHMDCYDPNKSWTAAD